MKLLPPIAQLAEQVPFKDKVPGSIPGGRIMRVLNSQQFKKRCIALRSQGLTLGEIMHVLCRSKSSVYFHIRQVILSPKQKEKIAHNHVLRIREFNHARKGKSTRSFKRFNQWGERKITLVSHLLFDGELTHSACVYNNRSRVLIERVRDDMHDVYDYEPREIIYDGVIRISYFNVALAAYLKEKSLTLLREIHILPLELKRAFLKAFYNDEGCMDFNGNTRRVRGYQHSYAILLIVQKLLTAFNIPSRIDSGKVEIKITGRENITRFAREINFSPGVRVNGNRSNSIWKQSLEKREILRRALTSYQHA